MENHKKKIMIVDDALFSRKLLRKVLEKASYQVVSEVESGYEAVQKYAEVKPDFVMMDIVMPRMDGISAIKSIKIIDPEARIIIVSSIGSRDKVLQALHAGALNFVLKPFQPEQIIDVLQKIEEMTTI